MPVNKAVAGAPAQRWSLLDFELSELQVAGLVLLCGALSGMSFLFSGYPAFGDVWPHLVRIQVTYEAFKAGHLPGWSFFFYNGYPLLRFYSPLFYYLAAAISFLFNGNPFVAVKVTLFLLHVASGIAVYYLARRMLVNWGAGHSVSGVGEVQSSSAAFVAAFGYLFSYWHLMFVIGFGQYPAGLVFTLIPLSLWLLDRLGEQPGPGRAIIAGIVIALLPLTHVFYAYFWIPFLIIWFLPVWRRCPARRGRQVGWALAAVAIALLLSAFFTIPFFIEGMRYRMPQPAPNSGAPSAWTLVGLSQEMSGYSGSYVGLGIILLASLGIVRLIREQKLFSDASFWGLVLSVLLAFGGSVPLISRIPLVGELPAERFLIFSLLFVVLLAGPGYQLLREHFRARWLWIPVVVLIALDLGSRLYNNVYRPAEQLLESRDYVYQKLRGRQDGRLLDAPVEGRDPARRLTRYPASGFLFGGLPSVFGPPYHQFAPRSMLYAYAWTDDIASEFLDSTQEAFSPRALRELRLLDAKYVVTLPTRMTSAQGMTYVFLKKGLTWDDTLLRRVVGERDDAESTGVTHQPFAIGTFEGLSPVIVAPRAVARNRLAGEPAGGDSWQVLYTYYYIARDWAELPEKMDLDAETGVAGRIITLDLTDSLPSRSDLQLDVMNIAQQQERVELQLAVNADCFARLAYSFYPELQAQVDGTPVRVWETADHFLLIRLPAGRHNVVIVPMTTPLRRVTGGISAIAFLLCVLGLAASAVRRPLPATSRRQPASNPDPGR